MTDHFKTDQESIAAAVTWLDAQLSDVQQPGNLGAYIDACLAAAITFGVNQDVLERAYHGSRPEKEKGR